MESKMCPKCGAESVSPWRYHRNYACGRSETYDNPGCEGEPALVKESLGCLHRQLAAARQEAEVAKEAIDVYRCIAENYERIGTMIGPNDIRPSAEWSKSDVEAYAYALASAELAEGDGEWGR